MGLAILRLMAAALMPVLFAAIFFQLEKRGGRFAALSFMKKQAVIGLIYGMLAILSTEIGIPVEGAVLNVRNAAPLTAGLVFGWPAGVISGLIGGIQRWLAGFWGVSLQTRLAGTVATIFAGFFGAYVRRFMIDNKKASWLYGLIIGMTTEVIHMLILFVTNISDLQGVFAIVQKCALPMIFACGFSVMCSALLVGRLSGQHRRTPDTEKKISQMVQRWLLICVGAGLFVTGLFTYNIQTNLATDNARQLLTVNLSDVRDSIMQASDDELLRLTELIAQIIQKNDSSEQLALIAKSFSVTEINIVNVDGVITASNVPENVGFRMDSGAQSREFLSLLNGEKSYVQRYQPITRDSSVLRKYAGVAMKDGFVQVGYGAELFQSKIAEEVVKAAQYRHIGRNGSMIICDAAGMIVSDRDGHDGQNIGLLGYSGDHSYQQYVVYEAEIYGEESLFMYTKTEGYNIIAVLPEKEAMFSRDAAVYMLAFMEVVVFAALFVHVFFLINRLVVRNIQKINSSLGRITGGDLTVTVNVRASEEFSSLSDDINHTVETLRRYIDEAAARIDQELEFARQIQLSALPSVFPPYPERKDFSIYASMDTAKEVGGDFYDFYLIGEKQLAFLIADVSGKGIPAAMFMMTAKTLIKSLVESGKDVDEAFTQANETLCKSNEAGMFVTAWLGILDTETGRLRFANAGHNPPAIRRKNGQYEYLKSRVNLVLAGMEGIRYRKNEIMLEPGDTLYLYTDGVTEAQNEAQELYGEPRLLDSLNAIGYAQVEKVCRRVKQDVDAFTGNAQQFDDITMLCVRLNDQAEEPDDGAMIETTPDMASVAQVSAFIEAQAHKLCLPQETFIRVMIAVDEVYSNIVRYSGATKAQVRIRAQAGTLELCFTDDGRAYNPLSARDPDVNAAAQERRIGGLGVFMIKKIMDTMEYEYLNGKNKLTLTEKYEK